MSFVKKTKAGQHSLLTFTQFEQGVLRSHLILRCWQRTQASMRGCLCDCDCDDMGMFVEGRRWHEGDGDRDKDQAQGPRRQPDSYAM